MSCSLTYYVWISSSEFLGVLDPGFYDTIYVYKSNHKTIYKGFIVTKERILKDGLLKYQERIWNPSKSSLKVLICHDQLVIDWSIF